MSVRAGRATTAKRELLRKDNATRGDERRGVRISGPFWRAADESLLLAGEDRTLTILSAPVLRDPPTRVGMSPT